LSDCFFSRCGAGCRCCSAFARQIGLRESACHALIDGVRNPGGQLSPAALSALSKAPLPISVTVCAVAAELPSTLPICTGSFASGSVAGRSTPWRVQLSKSGNAQDDRKWLVRRSRKLHVEGGFDESELVGFHVVVAGGQ
jgi:hypothetical protein